MRVTSSLFTLACIVLFVSCSSARPPREDDASRIILPQMSSSKSSAASLLSHRADDALVSLLTRRDGNGATMPFGSALYVDRTGQLLTTVSTLSRVSLDHIGAGVLIASVSDHPSLSVVCESIASVVRIDRARDFALLRSFAPVRPDCVEVHNFLDDWNKFHSIDFSADTTSVPSNNAVLLHGFTHSLPLTRISQPLSLSSLSGSLRATSLPLTQSGSPLFAFDRDGRFIGMLSAPMQQGAEAILSSSEELRQWLAKSEE